MILFLIGWVVLLILAQTMQELLSCFPNNATTVVNLQTLTIEFFLYNYPTHSKLCSEITSARFGLEFQFGVYSIGTYMTMNMTPAYSYVSVTAPASDAAAFIAGIQSVSTATITTNLTLPGIPTQSFLFVSPALHFIPFNFSTCWQRPNISYTFNQLNRIIGGNDTRECMCFNAEPLFCPFPASASMETHAVINIFGAARQKDGTYIKETVILNVSDTATRQDPAVLAANPALFHLPYNYSAMTQFCYNCSVYNSTSSEFAQCLQNIIATLSFDYWYGELSIDASISGSAGSTATKSASLISGYNISSMSYANCFSSVLVSLFSGYVGVIMAPSTPPCSDVEDFSYIEICLSIRDTPTGVTGHSLKLCTNSTNFHFYDAFYLYTCEQSVIPNCSAILNVLTSIVNTSAPTELASLTGQSAMAVFSVTYYDSTDAILVSYLYDSFLSVPCNMRMLLNVYADHFEVRRMMVGQCAGFTTLQMTSMQLGIFNYTGGFTSALSVTQLANLNITGLYSSETNETTTFSCSALTMNAFPSCAALFKYLRRSASLQKNILASFTVSHSTASSNSLILQVQDSVFDAPFIAMGVFAAALVVGGLAFAFRPHRLQTV